MKANILVVDDQENNVKLLQKILEKEGYVLQVARDGQEGVDSARRQLPDLILLDIMMPQKDGFQVCEELRQDSSTEHIPIIFLSAKTETEDIVKGLDAGGNDYVTKPFNKTEVLARVRTHLKIYQLTKALKAANDDLQDKQNRLDEDLQAAAVIQKSLLPVKEPEITFGRLAWSFLPCDRVGGDIFNFFRLDEEHWALYILDVSGHGVPSSMIAVSVSNMLNPHTGLLIKKAITPPPYYEIISPGNVLAELDQLYPFERFQKYFTMTYVICNCLTGELQYSSGGHPPPLVIRKSGEIRFLEEGGTLIGLGGVVPFEEGTCFLEPGDRLFLYTDGITEHQSPSGEFFGRDRFQQTLSRQENRPLDQATDEVFSAVMTFGAGQQPDDDVSLLGFEFQGTS